MTPPTHSPSPSNDLAEIAALFLSESRANTAPGRPRPTRIPPASQAPAHTTSPVGEVGGPPPGKGDPALAPSPTHATSITTLENPTTPVHLLIAPHISPERLPTFAGQIAAALTPPGAPDARVGILIPGSGLYLLDAGLPIDHAPCPVASSAKELAEHVTELSFEVDAWLVAATDLDTDWELLARASAWIVPADPAQPGQVAAYTTLKSLVPLAETPIRLASVSDTSRITAAAQQFLSRTLAAPLALSATSPALHPLLTYPHDLREVALSLFRDPAANDHTGALALSPLEEVRDAALTASVPASSPPMPPAADISSSGNSADALPPEAVATETAATKERSSHSFASPQVAPTLTLPPPTDVLDLPAGQSPLASILAANPHWTLLDLELDDNSALVTTPANQLALIATVTTLADLPILAARIQWLTTTRPLLARIAGTSSTELPTISLYLAHDLLPLAALLTGRITVIPTRQIQWGLHQGLLLQAA